MTHLDDEQVVDALEAGPAATHAEGCAACGQKLRELRETLGVAHAADVPEPSPFYWASFRRQVGSRIEAEGDRAPRTRMWAGFAVLATAAALAAFALRGPEIVPVAAVAAPLPSWSALPDDDPAADVLAGLAPDTEMMREAGCAQVAECVAGLTDEESSELVALLRDELATGGKL